MESNESDVRQSAEETLEIGVTKIKEKAFNENQHKNGKPLTVFGKQETVLSLVVTDKPVPSPSSVVNHGTSANDDDQAPYIKSVIGALCICIGSIVVGTTIGYPSPAVPDLNDHSNPFHVTDEQSSWIGSMVPLGAFVGGLIGGPMTDLLGRKLTIMCTALGFAVSWVLIASSPVFELMVAGRAISGVSSGVVSVACPVYVGEISPPSIRGFLGSFYQMGVCIGILFVYGFGAFLSWNWLGIACLAWSIILIVAVVFIPESPRWLLSVKQKEAAEDSLHWLRGKDFKIEKEMAQLDVAIKEAEDKASFTDFLKPELYKPLLICLTLMLLQQFSGVNVIMFYTVDIFNMAQVDMDPNVETVIVGAVGVVGTLVSVFVADLAGRRILLGISGTAMTITIAAMGAYFYVLDNNPETALSSSMSWLPITCLVIFNFGYNVAFGPLPWVMMSELFPLRAKALASSLVSASNWLFCFLLTKFWVNMTAKMTVAGGYWFCASFCLLSVPFIFLFVPETKGKTLEEISTSFK